MDCPISEDVEKNSLALGRIRKVSVRKRPDARQRVIALMLHAGLVHVLEIVEGRVIKNLVANDGEIQSLITRGFEYGKIRVVRKQLIRRIGDGTCGGMRNATSIESHDPIVGAAGFKHQAWPRSAARVNVHSRPHFGRPGVKVHERPCAEHSGLFAVIYEENDRVRRRRKRFQCTRDFKDCSGADTVVGISRASWDGIVVSGNKNG